MMALSSTVRFLVFLVLVLHTTQAYTDAEVVMKMRKLGGKSMLSPPPSPGLNQRPRTRDRHKSPPPPLIDSASIKLND
ncbi:hypothetical protein M5689_001435 [Euphorbia peplus]|nr:hypothetical protein M5689_001435 [Euphorbia peplus]